MFATAQRWGYANVDEPLGVDTLSGLVAQRQPNRVSVFSQRESRYLCDPSHGRNGHADHD
jgi:hypothetical protein